MAVDPAQVSYLKIFPPIGIARVGDSGFDLSTGNPDGAIEWFLPSEIPGSEDMPAALGGSFRDAHLRIKRQAVLFHVYAYHLDDENRGTILGEITSGGGSAYTLTWRVHVANKKPAYREFAGEFKSQDVGLRNPDVQPDMDPDQRFRLIVDPGVKDLQGENMAAVNLDGAFQGSQANAVQVNLGQIRTDAQGRLIFIGGAGWSRSVAKPGTPNFQPDIISEFDSIDWVDDTCDGWVEVTVEHPDFENPKPATHKSTIISAPPKFSWGIQSPTSLYELTMNTYRNIWKDHDGTDFYQDIWPVMHGSYAISWVNTDAYDGHGVAGKGNFLVMRDQLATLPVLDNPTDEEILENERNKILREHVFQRLRLPDYQEKDQALTKYMPRLSGNDGDAIEPSWPLRPGDPIKRFAALTTLQYERFATWKDGIFSNTPAPWTNFASLDQVPMVLRPTFLTRAALEHTVGEPLYPGIEVHWSAKAANNYIIAASPDNDPPFRFNHTTVLPGHIGRGLSLPWQSDFDLCNTHWWPSARPDNVISIDDFVPENVTVDNFISDIVPMKMQWSRGLRVTPDYPTQFYPGSTDMIRLWHTLGFVAKTAKTVIAPNGFQFPVWVERDAIWGFYVPEEPEDEMAIEDEAADPGDGDGDGDGDAGDAGDAGGAGDDSNLDPDTRGQDKGKRQHRAKAQAPTPQSSSGQPLPRSQYQLRIRRELQNENAFQQAASASADPASVPPSAPPSAPGGVQDATLYQYQCQYVGHAEAQRALQTTFVFPF